MLDVGKTFYYSRDIGLLIDPAGSIVAGTLGSEEILAYGTLGLSGTPLADLLDEALRIPIFGGQAAAARLYRDIHLKTASGRILTIHAVAYPLDDTMEPKGTRFLMEQEIHLAVPEARGVGRPLGLLFDSIGAAVWSFDPEGTVLTWNRASEAYFGHSRAGKFSPAAVFMSVDDLRRIREAVDSSGHFRGDVQLLSRDGKAHANNLWAARLISEDDDPVGYACVSIDPEEYKRVQDLQASLAQQPGDAALLIDRQTTQIVDANFKACDLLCCSRDDLARRRALELLAEGKPSVGQEIMGALQNGGSVQLGRQLLKRKDGYLVPSMATFYPVTLGRDQLALAFITDLSERVRAEDMIRKEREEAEKRAAVQREGLERLLRQKDAELEGLRKEAEEARGRAAELIGKVAEAGSRQEEELRRRTEETRRELEQARQRLEEAGRREEEMREELEKAGLREDDLRRRIEELESRPPPPPPEPPRPAADVNRVLEEALALFQQKSGHKVRVTKALKPVSPVECLPELLKEVLLSALDGIAEGTAKKGRVAIRTRQTRRGAVIEIADRGGTIGPTVLARLFDPSLADSKSRVTAALVPAAGGKIAFRMGRGKSAVCRIELPSRS